MKTKLNLHHHHLPHEIIASLTRVLDYSMDDERASFEALSSSEERERHIFCDLELLGQWLSKVEDHPHRRAGPVSYIREVVARYRGPWRAAGAITQPADAAGFVLPFLRPLAL